jgi:hypothetical protein
MTFAKLCREADKKRRSKPKDRHLERLRKLLDDDVSLTEAWYELNVAQWRSRAADSTVEALVYQLRKGGAVFGEPSARRRLSELSEHQLHEVSTRLQKFRPHIARAWTSSEVELLVQMWSDLHG